MHPNNLHNNGYDFKALQTANPSLVPFVFRNDFGTETIDFSKSEAVLQLNKALLIHHYRVSDWNIPAGYLCPPIPGRADYIHYLADLFSEEELKTIYGLDIGVGANCIYPILATQLFDWQMLGCDINETAIAAAQANIDATPGLDKKIKLIHQTDNAQLFGGIIKKDDYFHFTMCNPPFHASAEEATKSTLRKLRHVEGRPQSKREITRNFGGQASELWCNGGEGLFIKRMIKQSTAFKHQVGWFTTLVSKKENLNKFYKQLDKLNAKHQTIIMEQGNKKSRILLWKYPG